MKAFYRVLLWAVAVVATNAEAQCTRPQLTREPCRWFVPTCRPPP